MKGIQRLKHLEIKTPFNSLDIDDCLAFHRRCEVIYLELNDKQGSNNKSNFYECCNTFVARNSPNHNDHYCIDKELESFGQMKVNDKFKDKDSFCDFMFSLATNRKIPYMLCLNVEHETKEELKDRIIALTKANQMGIPIDPCEELKKRLESTESLLRLREDQVRVLRTRTKDLDREKELYKRKWEKSINKCDDLKKEKKVKIKAKGRSGDLGKRIEVTMDNKPDELLQDTSK